jgi:hypothetical protein
VLTKGFTEKAGPRLGTVIATSGAAVNPNWGYHTNPVAAFLLTIFNVRLGWWVGNTKKPIEHRNVLSRFLGERVAQPGPRVAIWSLLAELLGWTNSDSDFVNLSDGVATKRTVPATAVRLACQGSISFTKSFTASNAVLLLPLSNK